MLRPFANVFAFWSPDPARMAHTRQKLGQSGKFEEVGEPAQGWVAAVSPLPGGAPDDPEIRARGIIFCEGRDRLEHVRNFDWLHDLDKSLDDRPAKIDRYPGDFTFLRLRPDGDATVVRSCAGVVPTYLFREKDGSVSIATLLDYIPQFVPGHFELDPLIGASFLSCMTFIDQRSFLTDVSILPRATVSRISPGRPIESERYWDPRPSEGDDPAPDPDHPRELRSLLLSALERDLAPANNLLTLSGGVDSSSLGALIRGTLGLPLSSWSLVPPASNPRYDHEVSCIEDLGERYGISPMHLHEFSHASGMKWAAEQFTAPFPHLNPGLSELPRIAAGQEVDVLVGGEFADDVCGQMLRINDWVDNTTLRDLLRPGALPFGRRDYLRWTKRKVQSLIRRRPAHGAHPLPDWVDSEVTAEYRAWVAQEGRRLQADKRPLPELAAHMNGDYWVDMEWEATSRLGVRRSIPFFNREILDLAFRCHPSELLRGGPKRLLREALKDDVDPRWLGRRDKGQWGHLTAQPKSSWPSAWSEPRATVGTVVREDWRTREILLGDLCVIHACERCALHLSKKC